MNLVSVVIPTQFSHQKVLDAVRSVLDQTYKNIEVILVQDGAAVDSALKDETAGLLAGLSMKIEILDSKQGAAAARNRGVELAKGSLIAFLDDDDVWFKTKIEKQVNAFEENSKLLSIVSCDYELASNSRAVRLSANNPLKSLNSLLMTNILGGCSFCMVRRDEFLSAGGFDVTFPSAQDWDLWVRIFHKFGSAYIIPEVLVKYSDAQNTSRISRSSYNRMKGYALFLNKHHKLIPASTIPYHLMRLIQFGINDWVGVKAVTKTVGPAVRKITKLLGGNHYNSG